MKESKTQGTILFFETIIRRAADEVKSSSTEVSIPYPKEGIDFLRFLDGARWIVLLAMMGESGKYQRLIRQAAELTLQSHKINWCEVRLSEKWDEKIGETVFGPLTLMPSETNLRPKEKLPPPLPIR